MPSTDNTHPVQATSPVPAVDRSDDRGAADGSPDSTRVDGRSTTVFQEAYRRHPSFLATRARGEEGSLVTEYGLLAVVAATICGVVIQWASGGAIVRLFNGLLNHAREIVGA